MILKGVFCGFTDLTFMWHSLDGDRSTDAAFGITTGRLSAVSARTVRSPVAVGDKKNELGEMQAHSLYPISLFHPMLGELYPCFWVERDGPAP